MTDVAELYYDLADRLQITHLLDRIIELPRDDRWSSMARARSARTVRRALRAHRGHPVLRHRGLHARGAVRGLAELNSTLLSRAKTTLDDIRGSDNYELSSLSVAMRVIRTLLRTGV
ncbi:hypothetical protein GCM10020229_76750 [Kitasatospora albolonga]|uniref:hypothetical protein n=1 Tax=Kitasatospora albolonga TaxID=68173 RepID=UPI0031F18207